MTVMPVGQDDGAAAPGPPPEFVAALVAELPALRRAVVAVVGRPRLRDDVVQEALLRACRSWRSFDPSRPMGPWLRRLAVVSVAELDRGERRAAEPDPRPRADAPGPGSDDHVVALDRRREVRAALGALTARDRSLLWRHDVDELPYDVLAALAGGSAVGARKAVSRARHRFRVAYLAVVGTGQGCLVGMAATLGRLRHRAATRAEAALERLLPLLPAAAAVVVVTVVAGVPSGTEVSAAADGMPPGAAAAHAAGSSVAGAAPLVLAADTPASAPAPAGPAPSGPAGATSSAVVPPAGLRAGPTGAGAGVGLEQPTPANDAIWYQGVEVRCDRSALLASTCAVLRATPAGDGVEVTAPTAPADSN